MSKKRYEIKTIKIIDGKLQEKNFSCDETSLDEAFAKEKANKNIMKIFVDNRQVFP